MNPSVVFYEVLVLFIIMAAGFAAAKFKIIGEGTRKSLSSFIINITLPIVILMSSQIEFTQEKIINSFWLMVLYALKDFLIKRLGSLLEHTT